MKVKYLCNPSRVLAVVCAEYLAADPKDGKEKYMLGACTAHTLNAHLMLLDPETMEVEDIETPGGIDIWGLLYLPDYERLMVATYGMGWLHALDMKTRTWLPSLRIEGQTYVWNLTRGGDGKVYGGNYPGCILYCYDPEEHTLTSAGRVGSNPGNMYSRMAYSLPSGNILVTAGMVEPETYLFDVKTRQMRKVFEDFGTPNVVADGIIVMSRKGKSYVYDGETLELLEGPLEHFSRDAKHPKSLHHLNNRLDDQYMHLLPYRSNCFMRKLKDGRIIGYFKQQIFTIQDNRLTFHDVKATPPANMIHGLGVADDGVVWFASGFGQAMGYYDPKTGEFWNSASITRMDGQPYGVVPHKGKVFFTAYGGGDHVIYDPTQPWNQYENVNPKTLQSVTPQKMGRPVAGTILGPDGNYWTGWCGTYGIYGGGLSRVNAETYEVTGWFGLAPEQCIRYIAAGKNHIYGTSHWMNSGMPYRFDDEFRLLRVDMEGNVVWQEQFQKGQFPECLAVVNGRLYMSMRDRLDGMAKIYVYDEETMEKLTVKALNPLGGPGKYEMEQKSIRHLLRYGEDKLIVFIDNEAHLMDAATLQILQTAKLDGIVETCAVNKDLTVYFSIDEKLYQLNFDA